MAARAQGTPSQASGGEQPPVPGGGEVQEKVGAETEQGFRGVETDGTPNEHYTVDGVTAGKPVPETDPEQARKATEHLK